MELATACIESVVHELQLLEKNLRYDLAYILGENKLSAFTTLKLNLACLRTFLWGARKWSINIVDLDLELNGESLQSFLSTIGCTLKTYQDDIHSLCLRPQSEYVDQDIDIFSFLDRSGRGEHISAWEPVVFGFRARIMSFKPRILQTYRALLNRCSSQSRCSCLRDEELVEFIKYLRQDLAGLRRSLLFNANPTEPKFRLHAQIEALQDELIFLKNLIGFAKLGSVELGLLDALSNRLEYGALHATLISYECSFYNEGNEGIRVTDCCSKIGRLLRVIKPVIVNSRLLEMYIKVLSASRTSARLRSMEMGKHTMGDFNDSLINRLWEPLWSSTSLMGPVKRQMQILYEGLRFLRSILRELPENVLDELNPNIGDVMSCAGIIICALFASEVEQIPYPLDGYIMLGDTNKKIKRIRDETGRWSMTTSLPSDNCLAGQEVCNSFSSPMSSTGMRLLPPSPRIPEVHEVVIGFDDEAQTIIGRLITSESSQLEIVPIVGMPGLGKTTLAKKVYGDAEIEGHFHLRLWCTVSHEYNQKRLLLELLCCNSEYTQEQLREKDEHDLLTMLYQMLKGKKYLLVLDDVWDSGLWNDLNLAFQDAPKGSKILITSRFSNITARVNLGEPHYLRLLTEEQSWQLLQKKVFGEEECPQSVHGAGIEIARFCGGLPLTVVIIAGFLATLERDSWIWEEFARRITLTMVCGTDPCKASLELSYENLPPRLKACFLYFAAFREAEKIGTKNLVCLWIAEGLVERIQGRRMEDVAGEYLMSLIGRNLVTVSECRSIGGVKSCCLHDLLLEFCKARAKEENFLHAFRGYGELSTFNEPADITRVSICTTGEDFSNSRLFCPRSRSLLFFYQTAAEDFPLVDSSFLFCIYKHLIVLNLEHIALMQKEFPSGVESLLELRYLALRSNSMEFIPQSIANLSNLETFRLKSHETVSLPDTIWNMKKLRVLCVWICARPLLNDDVLKSSSTLPNLDFLSTLILPLSQAGENIIRKIPHVRRLKILVSDNEGAWEATGSCNLSQLESLESLTVMGGFMVPGDHNIEYFFPSALKKLSLSELGLPWSKISLIEQLPNLEVLKLLVCSFRGDTWELAEGGFPKLKVLTLSQVDVVMWTEADPDSDDHFPCLERLNLEGNLRLEKVPSCLGSLSTLKMVKVRFWGEESNYDNAVDNYSVVNLVRGIEKEQINNGIENLKILIRYVLPRY
ncbi:putative late blight resistance protein homolog R1A-3 [Coffea arabica]|uniref:Late blight resistance protein homolog R1B-14 n=1 Tax=Coffea arabica TaxID=13443 RepID=A0A6P6S4H1_COFAR|nr:putative late blight resistance protein homolog R1B-14 [Coffea arabica]XP_027061055.1 putative late blight resistance protein homolog R1B-14 [Coffea arabica]